MATTQPPRPEREPQPPRRSPQPCPPLPFPPSPPPPCQAGGRPAAERPGAGRPDSAAASACCGRCQYWSAAVSGRAAMRRWRLLPSVVLLAVLVPVRGNFDDFNLEEALATTKKPLPSRKPASDLDDFNLEDAFNPDEPKPDLPANPRDTDNPKQVNPKPKDTGSIEDSDLFDSSLPKGGGDERKGKGPSPNNGETAEVSEGAIAGIVSAVFATVVGAVSSFIAYQKKKLCFKQSDEENVNMDSHRGAQSEPPVQRTLLEN